MKNSIKILAAIAMFGFAGNASAQSNVATATASATVVTPISISPTTGAVLQFGNVVGGNNVQAIETMTGSYAHVNYSDPSIDPGSATNAGTISYPTFTVNGQANFGFTIAQTAVTGLGAGFSVSLPPNTTGTLDGTGTATFNANGATLTVPANAPTGTQTGIWTETVNYY